MEDFVANFDRLISEIEFDSGCEDYRQGNDIALCLDSIGTRPEEVDKVIITLYTEEEKVGRGISIRMVSRPTEFTFEQLVEHFGKCNNGRGRYTTPSIAMYCPTFILKNGDIYHMIDQELCEFDLIYPASTIEPFDEATVVGILTADRRRRL